MRDGVWVSDQSIVCTLKSFLIFAGFSLERDTTFQQDPLADSGLGKDMILARIPSPGCKNPDPSEWLFGWWKDIARFPFIDKSTEIYGADLVLFLYLEIISMTVLYIEILQHWACLHSLNFYCMYGNFYCLYYHKFWSYSLSGSCLIISFVDFLLLNLSIDFCTCNVSVLELSIVDFHVKFSMSTMDHHFFSPLSTITFYL